MVNYKFLMMFLQLFYQSLQILDLLRKTITVNPRTSPRGLICKNEFLGGGLFEGVVAYSRGVGAYLKGGAYFKV